ncbi:MAG: globin domain-containing protein [Pseudomonadota bacterium]
MERSSKVIVRETWAKAAAAHVDLARLFYGRLFTIAPETRVLFKNDMDVQGRKLVATLAFVIDNLSNEETLAPAAEDLALRHLEYNVKAEHYGAVAEALLWTLDELLGSGFDEDAKAAWTETLNALAGIMIAAAHPETTQAD